MIIAVVAILFLAAETDILHFSLLSRNKARWSEGFLCRRFLVQLAMRFISLGYQGIKANSRCWPTFIVYIHGCTPILATAWYSEIEEDAIFLAVACIWDPFKVGRYMNHGKLKRVNGHSIYISNAASKTDIYLWRLKPGRWISGALLLKKHELSLGNVDTRAMTLIVGIWRVIYSLEIIQYASMTLPRTG
jgi:hypothetical protein